MTCQENKKNLAKNNLMDKMVPVFLNSETTLFKVYECIKKQYIYFKTYVKFDGTINNIIK